MSALSLPTPLVLTDAVLRARRRALFAAEQNRLVRLTGPAGSGKSTAAEDAVSWVARQMGIRIVSVMVPFRPAPKEISVRICQALTGSAPSMSGYELSDYVVELLGRHECLFLFDEAQHLGLPGMEQVKYLWERQRFGALIVGDTRLRALLAKSPQLDSRVGLGVHFELLAGDPLHEVVRTFHSAFAAASRPVLTRIEREHRGNLRRWRDIAVVLDELSARSGRPADLGDKQLLDALLAEFA